LVKPILPLAVQLGFELWTNRGIIIHTSHLPKPRWPDRNSGKVEALRLAGWYSEMWTAFFHQTPASL